MAQMTLALLVGVMAWTAERPRVSVRVERDIQGMRHQQALVFDNGALAMTRNSNFYCASAEKVQLGRFAPRVPADHNGAIALMEQVHARVVNNAGSSPGGKPNPHALRAFVGAREVSGLQSFAPSVEDLVARGCEPRAWVARNGVEVERRGRGRGARVLVTQLKDGKSGKTLELKESEACMREGQKLRCVIPDWGIAVFGGQATK